MKNKLWKISVCLLSLIGVFCLVFAVACLGNGGKNDSKAYSVTFETYGGSAVEKIGINAGDKINAPAAPTKTDATFKGWYLDEDFEEEFPFSTALAGKNYTAYARWTVTVSYEVNGGTAIAPVQKDAKDMMILPTPTADGKIFFGWCSDAALTQPVNKIYSVPNDSVTLYAKWGGHEEGTAIDLIDGLTVNEANSYTKTEGDEVKFTTLAGKGEWSYVYTPLYTDLTGYTVIHFVFRGTKNQSVLVKLEGGGATSIEQKFVFTGEVQEEFWTVTAANIGTNTSLDNCQKFLFFVDPNVSGAAKSGTEFTVKTIDFCRLVGENDAQQEAIVFNTTGGSFVNAIYGAKDSAITLPTAPTKAGYTFAGWYTDKNCTEAFTAATMPEGPTVVYAKWVESTAYEVTFVTNCDLTVEKIEVRAGLKIDAPELKVSGWSFAGWFDDEELTKPSDLIMPDGNKTLYAKWLKLADLSDRKHPNDITTGWTKDMEGNGYTISDSDGEMTLTMQNKGTYNGVERDISDIDRTYINALHIVLDATEGHKITIFFGNADGWKMDMTKEITLAAAHIDEWVYLPDSLAGITQLKINYQNGVNIQEQTVAKFSKIELLNPIEKIDTVSVLTGWYANDAGHYTITENADNTVVTVTTAKGQWSFVRKDFGKTDIDFPNVYEIIAVVQGPAGHQLAFKLNNDNALQTFIDLTGAEQEIVIPVTKPLNGSDLCLFFFIDGIATVNPTAFDVVFKTFDLKIYHDDTVYEDKEIDLMDGTYTPFGAADQYTCEKTDDGLVITATPTKDLFNPINLDLSEFDVEKAFEIRVSFAGPAGHKLSFKYNNDNALQSHYALSGDEQDEIIIVYGIEKDKPLSIFIDVGTTVSENVSVTISYFKLVVKAPVEEAE